MGLIKTEAIVLKHMDYLEADRIIVLFSKELGKIHAIAKGSRKPKSRFLMASEVFVLADYVLYEGKNLYTVTQSEVKRTFIELRQDMSRLAYAAYIMNLCDSVIQEGEPNIRVFSLLIHTLDLLVSIQSDASALALIFAIKLMDFIGYRPLLDQCAGCGSKSLNDQLLYFSPIAGGLLCDGCAAQSEDAICVNPGFMNTLSHILSVSLSNMSRLKITNSLKKQLWDALYMYISARIEKPVMPMRLE